MKMVFIDSDLFVRDLRYVRDALGEPNRRFLDRVKGRKVRGVTSIFNLLEVCGILSFNYSPQDLTVLYADFTNLFNIQILFPSDSSGNLHYDISSIFSQIQKKQSLGDAEISSVVQRFSRQLSCFVSWNARHFEGKLSIPVMTPDAFLENRFKT